MRLAQQEWEESLEQLQQLVAIVFLPYLGKFLGRRWSHWGWFTIVCVNGLQRDGRTLTSLQDNCSHLPERDFPTRARKIFPTVFSYTF